MTGLVMGLLTRHYVVAVAVLFVFASLAGCLDNPEIDDEPSGEVELGEIDVYSVDKNGEKVWQIVMVITGEDFEGTDNVSWEQIHLDVIAPDGYVNGFELWPLNGPIPLEFGAKYIPKDPNSDFVNEGDMIIIHGVGEELEGGSVELFRGSTLLLEMDLPIQFEPDITVTFDDPVLDSIIFPGSTSYTYEAEVTEIDPANATLNWWTLQLRIESPTDAFGDFFGPLIENPGVEGYDGEDGPPEIEFWYIDDPLGGTNGPGNPTAMDEGDSVKITGLSETFEGGIVTLLKGEDPIWTSDPIPEMPEPNMVLELGSPIILTINRNDTAFWNVSIPISDVDPDDLIRWDSVWVRVQDSEGDVKFYSELFYQDPGDYCDTIEVHWNDDGIQDGVISIGDDIVIKGLDLTFQGDLIEIYRGLTHLDSVRLQSQWPILDLWISTKSPTFTNRTVGSEKYWDGSFNITHVNPENIEIPWEDIEIRIIDRGSNEVLIPLTHPELFEYEHRTVPTIFYLEGGTPDGVDYKDLIVLSGLNLSFERSYLEFYLNGRMIGEERLQGLYDPTYIVIYISSPIVNYYEFTDYAEYRIILNINKITPKELRVHWTNITVEVEDSTGAILIAKSPLIADTGVYDDEPLDGIDIGLWYIDVSSDDNMGAGDSFKLTGFTTDAEGGKVNIYLDGVLIWSARLPTDFP